MLKPALSDALINHVRVLQVSLAAAELCRWLQALCECANALQRLRLQTQQLNGEELRLVEAQTSLIQRKLEAQAAQLGFEAAQRHRDRMRLAAAEQNAYVEELEHCTTSGGALSDSLVTLVSGIDEMQSKLPARAELMPWMNALAALYAVCSAMIPFEYRKPLWELLKEKMLTKLQHHLGEAVCHYFLLKDVIRDGHGASAIQLLGSSGSSDFLRWLTHPDFPVELHLAPSNGNLTPTLCTVVCLRELLQRSVNDAELLRHTERLTAVLCDPDHVAVRLLKSLPTTVKPERFIYASLVFFDQDALLVLELDDVLGVGEELMAYREKLQRIHAEINWYKAYNFSPVFLTHSYIRDDKVREALSLLSEFNPVPVDVALTDLDFAGAVMSHMLKHQQHPRDDTLSTLHRLRSDDAVLTCETEALQTRLYTIMAGLAEWMFPQKQVHQVVRNCTDVGDSELKQSPSLNLVRVHIEILDLLSDYRTRLHRLNGVRQKLQQMEKRISLEAARTGARGVIPDVMRQVALMSGVLDFGSKQLLRWPCQRILNILARDYYRTICSMSMCKTLITSTCSEAMLRILGKIALRLLIQQFFSSHVLHPNWFLLKIKLCICLERLQHVKTNQIECFSAAHLPEVQWLEKMAYNVDYSCTLSKNLPEFLNASLDDQLEQLEETFEDLRGLRIAIKENYISWKEILEDPPNFLRTLPGFPHDRAVCVTHIFLVWITLKPLKLRYQINLIEALDSTVRAVFSQCPLIPTIPGVLVQDLWSLKNCVLSQGLRSTGVAANSQLVAKILKPTDHSMFGNGVILTSMVLMRRAGASSNSESRNGDPTVDQYEAYEISRLWMTTVPMGPSDHCVVEKVNWIDKWPPQLADCKGTVKLVHEDPLWDKNVTGDKYLYRHPMYAVHFAHLE
ncbi:unnamed protein product [Dicrocoelium dendriticum]|nr:unnamed protein product [Dicrocoelium dendriticum]